MTQPEHTQPEQTQQTLYGAFRAVAAQHPQRVAVLEPTDDGVVATTYAELGQEVEAARHRLAAHGVGRGDRLGYWAENRRDFLVWQLAAAAEGVTVLGINTRYRAVEVAHVLERGRPTLVVMPERLLEIPMAETLHAAAERAAAEPGWPAPQVALLPPAGDAPRDPGALAAVDLGAGAWWADEPVAYDAERPATGRPDDLAMVFTTSGSTGLPKLAGHDQAAVTRHAHEVARALGYTEGDVLCTVLPLTGVFSYVPTLAALAAGVTSLLVPVFDKAGTVRLMHEHGVTHVIGGDDLYDGLHRGWQEVRLPLERWRLAGVASFVGRVEQLIPWLEECSSAAMCGLYGSSEVFSLTSLRGLDEPQRHLGGGRLVSDGIEVRAVDPGTRSPVEPGTVGLLQFRGYNVLQAYVQGTELVDPPLEDGWFDSGDLGSVDPDGRSFTYAGRAGDALRLRGFLVQPSEIELFLIDHPAISGVKVVGVDDDGRDQAVAFVTVEPGHELDPEQVLAWCREELAAFKVPSRVIVIDEMPVTTGTNGSKVRTVELRRMAQELLAR